MSVHDCLSALANPGRLEVMQVLKRQGVLTSGEVAIALGVHHPTASRHLRQLEAAGLVTGVRRASFVDYTRNEQGVREFIEELKKEL